jgi:hypothetical membrane protein
MHAKAPVKPRVRLLALGGVIGPVVFVGSWAVAGATTATYSAVDDAISDLAAVDASTRVLMTVGFVVFGIGLVAFGFALRETLHGRAWIAAMVTGGSTIGVAATPLGGWSGDVVHAAFAGLGYAAIVALPLLAAAPLARAGRRRWARVSVSTAAIASVCLVASTFGPAHGLWQRLGLTAADAWIVVTAAALVAARHRGPSALSRGARTAYRSTGRARDRRGNGRQNRRQNGRQNEGGSA